MPRLQVFKFLHAQLGASLGTYDDVTKFEDFPFITLDYWKRDNQPHFSHISCVLEEVIRSLNHDFNVH